MKRIILIIAVLVVALSIWGFAKRSHGHETINYRLVTVEQGDLEAVVSSTGTLDAVTTVQVGTQVSGIIDEICVDFNDPVEEGQVVARIDTSLLTNAVAGAQANLARSEAELRHADREFERIKSLHTEKMVSDSEFNQAQYTYEAALASVQSSKVDLTRARQNLEYATITAPIGGTVIARSVEVGQTVQSSFSAPELFLIAGDLSKMQILASVDESDIGQIIEGQEVRFTVQAYPDDTFSGTVRQVRLQSATTENVVNYTAVVDVANPDGRLLPGMTATVDFLVETASDVTYVANAALRYKPDDETMMAAMEKMREKMKQRREQQGQNQESPGQEKAGRPDGGRMAGGMGGGMGGGPNAENRGALWTLDENGELAMIPVRTGITDGTNTQVMGRMLEAGQQIVAGVSSRAATNNQSSSPFQQQQQSGGRRPGPPSPGGF